MGAGLPSHGTTQRYWRGCRCLPCRLRRSVYDREQAIRREQSEMVSAAPARAHLRELRAKGIGRRQVSALTGVGHDLIREIRSGKRTKARRSTIERLLKCEPRRADGVYVTSWWAKRQIKALLAEGYTAAQIGRLIGRPIATIAEVDKLRLHEARKVRAVTAKLLEDDDEDEWRANSTENFEDPIP